MLNKRQKIYSKYADMKIDMLGNVVWQLLYNQPERKCAFVPIVETGLSIADKDVKGHTPTGVDLGLYPKNQDLAKDLNRDVLGLTEEEAAKIVMSSMRPIL